MNLNKENLNKENNYRLLDSICDAIVEDRLQEYDKKYIAIWNIINRIETDASYTYKELMSVKINQIKEVA